jgi:hypothetical protein
VFVQFHVHLAASEGDAFSFQPESLLEGVVSAQFDSASGAQDALPGQAHGAAERRYHLAGGTGKSGGFRNRSVGGNLALWDLADDRNNLLLHGFLRSDARTAFTLPD